MRKEGEAFKIKKTESTQEVEYKISWALPFSLETENIRRVWEANFYVG